MAKTSPLKPDTLGDETMFEYHGWATLRLTPGREHELEAFLDQFVAELRSVIGERFGAGSGAHEVLGVNGEYHVRVDGSTNHRHGQIFELFPYIAARAPGSYGLLYVWDDEHPLHKNAFRVWRLARGRVEELPDTFLSPCTPLVEDEDRGEDDLSALERETGEFVAAVNLRVPGLRVLGVTRDALLCHAREHGMLHLTLDDNAAVLAGTLNLLHQKQALLARAFVDIWYCSNFNRDVWGSLVEMDAALAELAVEACYYVFALSGANGGGDLRELLTAHNRMDAVDGVTFLASSDLARQWARSVRAP